MRSLLIVCLVLSAGFFCSAWYSAKQLQVCRTQVNTITKERDAALRDVAKLSAHAQDVTNGLAQTQDNCTRALHDMRVSLNAARKPVNREKDSLTEFCNDF